MCGSLFCRVYQPNDFPFVKIGYLYFIFRAQLEEEYDALELFEPAKSVVLDDV